MQVTANSNNLYTANTNKISQNKEADEEYTAGKIFTMEELLDEDGYAFFNGLLNGMQDEEKTRIKLILGFQMSIKSTTFINGEAHIERETGELNAQSILSKLETLSKNKDRTDEMNYVINELKAYYTDRNEVSINTKEDSVLDDFLESLYSNESIESASILVKEDMQNKVNEYAKTLGDELGDTEKSKMLNDYKQDLLKEHKEILEAINDETPSLKQQGIMKALLDESSQEEESSLALLLTQKTDSVQSERSTKNGANYYMKNLDEKGNKIVDNILSGRTDTEQFAIKAIMDRGLNFENTRAYAMAMDAIDEYYSKSHVDMSAVLEVSLERNNEFLLKDYELKNTQDYLKVLDTYIERGQKGVDKYGILEVAVQLRDEYMRESKSSDISTL